MNLVYRKAVPGDIPACIVLRGRTRENAFSVEQLEALGITLESWQGGVGDGAFGGYVAMSGEELAGYCFGERDSGEILVLALLPEYEGRGIGRRLLGLMLDEFKVLGFERLFLGCSADARTRSHGFYRYLGWRPTGEVDAVGDEVLEYFL